MRIRKFFAALCMAFILTILAAHSGSPFSIPKEFRAHVSIRSVDALLASVDKVVAAATKNTAGEIPEGMIPLMAKMYYPIPADGWQSDRPLHLLVPAISPEVIDIVLVAPVESVDQFIAAVEKSGKKVLRLDKESARCEAYMFDIAQNATVVVAKIDDGSIAIGSRLEAVRACFEGIRDTGWDPAHDGDADVSITLATQIVGNPMETAVQQLLTNQLALISELATYKINPVVVSGTVATAARYLPLFGLALNKIKTLRADLWLGTPDLRAALRLDVEDDSIFNTYARGTAKRDNMDRALAGMVAPGASMISVTAPPEAAVPGVSDLLTELASDMALSIFPEQREAIRANVEEILKGLTDEIVTFQVFRGDMPYDVTYMKTDAPDDLVKAIRESVETFNAVYSQVFPNSGYQFNYLGTVDATAGGDEYTLFIPVMNSEGDLRALFTAFQSQNPGFQITVDDLKRHHIYLAKKNGYVVLAVGRIEAAEFTRALEALDKTGRAMLDGPAARRVVDGLVHRQAGFMVKNGDEIMLDLGLGLLHRLDGEIDHSLYHLYLDTFEETKKDMPRSDDMVGVGYGTMDGHPRFEAVFPVRIINSTLNNFKLFNDKINAAMHSSAL